MDKSTQIATVSSIAIKSQEILSKNRRLSVVQIHKIEQRGSANILANDILVTKVKVEMIKSYVITSFSDSYKSRKVVRELNRIKTNLNELLKRKL